MKMVLVWTERGPPGEAASVLGEEKTIFVFLYVCCESPLGVGTVTPSSVPVYSNHPSQTPEQCTWNIVGGTQGMLVERFEKNGRPNLDS